MERTGRGERNEKNQDHGRADGGSIVLGIAPDRPDDAGGGSLFGGAGTRNGTPARGADAERSGFFSAIQSARRAAGSGADALLSGRMAALRFGTSRQFGIRDTVLPVVGSAFFVSALAGVFRSGTFESVAGALVRRRQDALGVPLRRRKRTRSDQSIIRLFLPLPVSLVGDLGLSSFARRKRTFAALLFGEPVFALFRGSGNVKNEILRDKTRFFEKKRENRRLSPDNCKVFKKNKNKGGFL